MAKKSIRDRLERLESERRFLDWFVLHRLCSILTMEELEAWASGRGLPDPIPHRQSTLDTMDRKSIRKLWEEEELRIRGRSKEEREFYVENGIWPEQTGRLHYFEEDGRLQVEWRKEAREGDQQEGT